MVLPLLLVIVIVMMLVAQRPPCRRMDILSKIVLPPLLTVTTTSGGSSSLLFLLQVLRRCLSLGWASYDANGNDASCCGVLHRCERLVRSTMFVVIRPDGQPRGHGSCNNDDDENNNGAAHQLLEAARYTIFSSKTVCGRLHDYYHNPIPIEPTIHFLTFVVGVIQYHFQNA